MLVSYVYCFESCFRIKENENAYPEVKEKEEYIKKVLKCEEDSFNKTVEKGSQILAEIIDKMSVGEIVKGEDVFKLHDTYGFPLDLTKEILAEKNLSLDESRFRELMEKQRTTARSNQAFKGGWDEASNDALKSFTTRFVGYTELSADTELKAILKDGQPVDSCSEGEDVVVLIETTPFYAESGGQVGDKGTVTNGDNVLRVIDTKKTLGGQYICECTVEEGSFYVNDRVHAQVDEKLRMATARNHTCAHLLQAALRKVLGYHVHQSGSYVDPYKCRFDFSHFSAMTVEEIAEAERLVNEEILSAVPVVTEELPIEEAQKRGAMALFGEKYGKVVRVVTVPDFSTEFCGGTHLTNTAQAGLFKITAETSVANGVRRIEAVTGLEVINNYNRLNLFLGKIGQAIKASGDNAILNRCVSLQNEVHELKKEIDRLNEKISASQLKGLFDNIEEVKGIKIITAMLNSTTADSLRKAVDKIKDNNDSFITVLAGVNEDKGNFVCCCSKEAIEKGANAGQIVRRVAEITGAKGGGKPDMAMSGIGDLGKIDEALLAVKKIVEETLKN